MADEATNQAIHGPYTPIVYGTLKPLYVTLKIRPLPSLHYVAPHLGNSQPGNDGNKLKQAAVAPAAIYSGEQSQSLVSRSWTQV